ncbi:MAG: phytanoyl-CoA dioxygenase family protein [Pseudomonadota bacterium]
MNQFDDLRAELEARGLTKLKNFVSPAAAVAAHDQILAIAKRQGVYTSKGWQRSQSRFNYPKPFRTALNALNHSSGFPNLISDDLMRMVRQLVGEPVTALSPGQQILFSLPVTKPWVVPSDVWHVDVPRLGTLGSPGVQMFTFLDEVQPKGGGTLVVSGSHRLLNTSRVLRSKELKRLLTNEPYFRALFDANRPPIEDLRDTVGSVDDIKLEVVELTGNVGDVYLMDLRVLHTLSPNTSDNARMMLTCRLPRTAIAEACIA